MTNNFARGFASRPPGAPRPVERGPKAEFRDVSALLLLLEATGGRRRGFAGGMSDVEEVGDWVGVRRSGERGCTRRSAEFPPVEVDDGGNGNS